MPTDSLRCVRIARFSYGDQASSGFAFGAIEGDEIHIRANFIIHRMRNDASAVYVGQYENILRRCDGRLKIHSRRSVLDNESLREHGAIAFIL